jgi:hypothetical protein
VAVFSGHERRRAVFYFNGGQAVQDEVEMKKMPKVH